MRLLAIFVAGVLAGVALSGWARGDAEGKMLAEDVDQRLRRRRQGTLW